MTEALLGVWCATAAVILAALQMILARGMPAFTERLSASDISLVEYERTL